MAIGSGPWGSTPFGSGSFPTLKVSRVDAIRENVIRVTFDRYVYYTGVLDPGDASNIKRYIVSPVESSRDSAGNPPKPVTPIRIDKPIYGDSYYLDIVLDREMSAYPAQYVLTMAGLKGKDGNPLENPATFALPAVYREIKPYQPSLGFANRDIANPQVLSALTGLPAAQTPENDQLGTYRVDGIGDVARDEGEVGYRKRIFRRLTTQRGRFAHLPSYGVGLPSLVKQLALPGYREQLASDSEQQIKQEPETAAVSVVIQPSVDNPELFLFVVRARMRLGQVVDMQFVVPVGVNQNV